MRPAEDQDIIGFDLFGQPVRRRRYLRDEFIEPPFSVLDTKSSNWVQRKAKWRRLGIKSEIGRDAVAIRMGTDDYRDIGGRDGYDNRENYGSVFDPVLCELMYKWFCPDGGSVLDPFAGGSVRGIVAGYLGHPYTGIELRAEQVESNRAQADEIIRDSDSVMPRWIVGDSNRELDSIADGAFDLVFTCPPYADLEVYSDLRDDLSNMSYPLFKERYRSILHKAAAKLKVGGFAAIVVGEIRRSDDRDGGYLGLVPMTVSNLESCGLKYYNEAVLLSPVASASARAARGMRTKKLSKIHQNVLIFKK